MLRVLMLDLKTMNEDRFTETMQDFYRSTRAAGLDRRLPPGGGATAGADMGWFFDQWVYAARRPDLPGGVSSEPRRAVPGAAAGAAGAVPESFLMYVPVTLELGKDGGPGAGEGDGAPTRIELPPCPPKPKTVRSTISEGVLAEVKMVDWRD